MCGDCTRCFAVREHNALSEEIRQRLRTTVHGRMPSRCWCAASPPVCSGPIVPRGFDALRTMDMRANDGRRRLRRSTVFHYCCGQFDSVSGWYRKNFTHGHVLLLLYWTARVRIIIRRPPPVPESPRVIHVRVIYLAVACDPQKIRRVDGTLAENIAVHNTSS